MTFVVGELALSRPDALLILISQLAGEDNRPISRLVLENSVWEVLDSSLLRGFAAPHQVLQALYVTINVLSHIGQVVQSNHGYVVTAEGRERFLKLSSLVPNAAVR